MSRPPLLTLVSSAPRRFREGLGTLGLFQQVISPSDPSGRRRRGGFLFSPLSSLLIQVQLFPSAFFSVFCRGAWPQLTAQKVSRCFALTFSEDQEQLHRETLVFSFWRHFLLECEGHMISSSRLR